MLYFQIVFLCLVVLGSTEFYLWKRNKKELHASADNEAEYWAFRERMARSWEEDRQRDLEKVRRSFDAWDHAMTKLYDSIEKAETVMLGTRPSRADLD
ncbi:MAG: hypothetical protein CBC82_04050 [Cellvibrionales bacterium TMED122]|nr:hypothetical protein [Halieaceae bacterium]OUV63856.1 MAG: hypothetical protein CBC82_04050 [Cellvibrionales bacterium TMED122]